MLSGYTTGVGSFETNRLVTPRIWRDAFGKARCGVYMFDRSDKSTILFVDLDRNLKWNPSSKKLLSYHLRSKPFLLIISYFTISSMVCPILRVGILEVEYSLIRELAICYCFLYLCIKLFI